MLILKHVVVQYLEVYIYINVLRLVAKNVISTTASSTDTCLTLHRLTSYIQLRLTVLGLTVGCSLNLP